MAKTGKEAKEAGEPKKRDDAEVSNLGMVSTLGDRRRKFVDIYVGGRGVRFLADTGAKQTCITVDQVRNQRLLGLIVPRKKILRAFGLT